MTFVFGATGTLTQQIEQGAPIDVFFAADESYLDRLRDGERIVSESQRVYAIGHLIIAVPRDVGADVPTVEALASPSVRRVAIANPEHAPYGRAARQALERAGVWEQIRSKVVYAENIAQTLQYLETGNVDVAILARSVVNSDVRWTTVDESLYDPLRQSAAVVRGSRQEGVARQFLDFVTGPEGRAVLEKYGFGVPGEP